MEEGQEKGMVQTKREDLSVYSALVDAVQKGKYFSQGGNRPGDEKFLQGDGGKDMKGGV